MQLLKAIRQKLAFMHRICGRVKLICNFFMAVWALQVQGRLALAGGRKSEGAR
jgi:hypothetical protein